MGSMQIARLGFDGAHLSFLQGGVSSGHDNYLL
jgi:hypothetical protein